MIADEIKTRTIVEGLYGPDVAVLLEKGLRKFRVVLPKTPEGTVLAGEGISIEAAWFNAAAQCQEELDRQVADIPRALERVARLLRAHNAIRTGASATPVVSPEE